MFRHSVVLSSSGWRVAAIISSRHHSSYKRVPSITSKQNSLKIQSTCHWKFNCATSRSRREINYLNRCRPFTKKMLSEYILHVKIHMPHRYDIYTIILLKSVCLSVCVSVLANGRSQFLHDLLGRCLKLFVSTDSTSCHEFASQFGLEFFYMRKTPKTIANTPSHTLLFIWMKQLPAFQRRQKGSVNFVMVGRTDQSNSDNQNGDGSGLVCACVCAHACVRACMHAWVSVCVMCLRYTMIIFDPGW